MFTQDHIVNIQVYNQMESEMLVKDWGKPKIF